jgi:4-amino-4-deoxy-L-arabinose transferase-like glycosyltransferase
VDAHSPRQRITATACALLLFVLIAAFVAFQAPALDKPFWEYDEGLNVIKAQLVGEGYWPHREIWSDQPPLFTLLLRLAFIAFGPSLAVGRAFVLGWAVLLLLAVCWATAEAAGRWAGLAATLLLALAPMFQELARTILIGLPAIALGTLAVAAALRGLRRASLAWLALAGTLFGLGMLTKPLIAPYYAPLLLCAFWARPAETAARRWWWRLLALHGAPALLLAVALPLFGPRAFLEQVLGTFTGARGAYGFSLAANLHDLGASFQSGYSQGLIAAALLSLALLAALRQRRFWLMSAWLGASLLAVLLHTPQRWHEHLVLLPPLCLLAATLIPTTREVAQHARLRTAIVAWIAATACLAWLVIGLPATMQQALEARVRPLKEGREAANTQLALDLLAAEVPPGSTIVTDDPMLAFLTGHTVPPQLAVPSLRRITTGSISPQQIVALCEQQPIGAVVFWQNRLDRLDALFEWARSHMALRATRSEKWFYVPIQPAWPQVAQSDSGFSLLGSSLDEMSVDPGGELELISYWRAEGDIAEDYVLFVHLLDAEGRAWGQHDTRPFKPTVEWKAGDAFAVRVVIAVMPEAPPGPKLLSVGWYDADGQRLDFAADGAPLPGGQITLTARPVVRWPAIWEPPAPATPMDATLGEVARLVGYDFALPTGSETTASLTLHWQAVNEASVNYKVFVHVADANDAVLAQSDAEPDGGARPTTGWRPGEYVADRHSLVWPESAGPFAIYVGMYDPASGARLPVAVDGAPRGDGRTPLTVTGPGPSR